MHVLKTQYGFENAVGLPILKAVSENGDSGYPHYLSDEYSVFSERLKLMVDALIKDVAKLLYKKPELPNIGFDEKVGVLIKYPDRDGFSVSCKELRDACICAQCKDEFNGKQIYDQSKTPDDIHPVSMNPVGNYALGINWSDGHASLYPYKILENL